MIDLSRYYHNITSNTLVILEAMAAHGVKILIYSSTCATYGEPDKLPITENTLQVNKKCWGLVATTSNGKFSHLLDLVMSCI